MSETSTYFTIQLTVDGATRSINTPKDVTAANISKSHCTDFLTQYQNAVDSTATIKNAYYLTTERRHVDLT